MDLPPSEATLRYRDHLEKSDVDLASHYWEAVWLEGARSPLLTALRQEGEKSFSRTRRAVVVLSGPADSRTQVSSQEYLPISVLPGRLDQNAAIDSRYGTVSARARERIAWDLAMRLAAYRDRALIVLGPQKEEDLRFVYEVLEDCPILESTLVVVWPDGVSVPHRRKDPESFSRFGTDRPNNFHELLQTPGSQPLATCHDGRFEPKSVPLN